MPRPLLDSEFLYGIHDPGGEQVMLDAGRPGWVLCTEAIGANPDDGGGRDYGPLSNRGLGVMTRLNYGYHPDGTIPDSSRYAAFAARCARFVAASPGCRIWIIGNEMNHRAEWPLRPTRDLSFALPSDEEPDFSYLSRPERFGAINLPEELPAFGPPSEAGARQADVRPEAEAITPQLYAACFGMCRAAIRGLPGHGEDHVVIGAVAPWNADAGDWIHYFQDILSLVGPDGCDGIALHTYTHGTQPELVTSTAKMDPPHEHKHFHFFAYRDFMHAVPSAHRQLPVYITETDQDLAWEDVNRGWVQAAYREIDGWNQAADHQQIRALVLYRWPKFNGDKWHFRDKPKVIEDFRQAMSAGYRWQARVAPLFAVGDTAFTVRPANLRRSPGFTDKAEDDVQVLVPTAQPLAVLGGPGHADGLTWWNLGYADPAAGTLVGWMAQSTPAGAALLARTAP